jgi:hypothetical protein
MGMLTRLLRRFGYPSTVPPPEMVRWRAGDNPMESSDLPCWELSDENNAREILISWLQEHGYDGLCCNDDYDGCGCLISAGLILCEGDPSNCVPGYEVEPPDWAKREGAVYWVSPRRP